MAQVTATFVKVLSGWKGYAQLFRLSTLTDYGEDLDTGAPTGRTDYVIVSAAVVPILGPQTHIFAANAEGECLDWNPIKGSFTGALDHTRAIREAGWVLA